MLVVTPNLCLDVTVRLPMFTLGSVARASSTVTTAGGKGVNVMRASAALGAPHNRLIGFSPDDDGARLRDLLADDGIELIGVQTPGQVRIATILLEDSGRASVINGRGPSIDEDHWRQLLAAVSDNLVRGEVLVCSGSLPPGVPTDGYAQLVRLAHDAGSPVVVDAAPAPLAAALPEGPDLVSPNLSEAEGLLHGRTDELVDEHGPDARQRAVAASRSLHGAGAARAVVTAGDAGAALSTRDGTWWLPAPAVRVASPIGAGDSFVAGAAVAMAAGRSDLDLLLSGIATAAASCESERAGDVDRATVAQLLAQLGVPEPSADDAHSDRPLVESDGRSRA